MTDLFTSRDKLALQRSSHRVWIYLLSIMIVTITILFLIVLKRYYIGMAISLILCILISSITGCYFVWYIQRVIITLHRKIKIYNIILSESPENITCFVKLPQKKYETKDNLIYNLILCTLVDKQKDEQRYLYWPVFIEKPMFPTHNLIKFNILNNIIVGYEVLQ